jgi:plasmid stabilization system protein ParE
MIAYKLDYLPSAVADILDIDVYLYERSPAAADKFADDIEQLNETLTRYPFIYPVYEDDAYFRHMTLSYKYRLFYHVDEKSKIVKIHRVLHGMRDVKSIMDGYGI